MPLKDGSQYGVLLITKDSSSYNQREREREREFVSDERRRRYLRPLSPVSAVVSGTEPETLDLLLVLIQ